jgi:hypothetical protein
MTGGDLRWCVRRWRKTSQGAIWNVFEPDGSWSGSFESWAEAIEWTSVGTRVEYWLQHQTPQRGDSMSEMDLETLSTEYEHIRAEMIEQHKAYLRTKRALGEAGDALIAAIIEAGLTEYGPITSTLQPYGIFGEKVRPVWSAKA